MKVASPAVHSPRRRRQLRVHRLSVNRFIQWQIQQQPPRSTSLVQLIRALARHR